MASTPSAPKPPNPYSTAAAQTGSNMQTAIAQSLLNQVNQVTPYGNLTYSQSGSSNVKQPVYDKNGNITGYKDQAIPQYTATQTLSPEQQKLYQQQSQLGADYNSLAQQQLGQAANILKTPIDLNNEKVESYLFDMGRKRLDPMWNERQQGMEAKMAGQGIAPGSEAYTNAMRTFDQGRNDQYTSLMLNGRGQAINEMMSQRQIPLNETLAMFGAGGVDYPKQINTPTTGVSGVDLGNLIGQQYQAQMNNYNQQLGQRNAMMGGLFGLGSAALGGWMG
jgi:hypothetical protein